MFNLTGLECLIKRVYVHFKGRPKYYSSSINTKTLLFKQFNSYHYQVLDIIINFESIKNVILTIKVLKTHFFVIIKLSILLFFRKIFFWNT